jgi:hypothetical protein
MLYDPAECCSQTLFLFYRIRIKFENRWILISQHAEESQIVLKLTSDFRPYFYKMRSCINVFSSVCIDCSSHIVPVTLSCGNGR